MSNILFILGAGFNFDARANVSGTMYSYPLLQDLVQKCFQMSAPPTDKSIEQLFQEALESRNNEPFQHLSDLLMEADYYIGQEFTKDATEPGNPYWHFLEHFPDSHFLTFNYDCLVEMLLFRLGRWRPDDGYGVPVRAELEDLITRPALPEKSKNFVLHLHGTFCVYPIEFYLRQDNRGSIEWITPVEPAQFVFDPDSVAHRFFPFRRILPGPSYEYPPQRVIAPIPNKAPELTREFIQGTYAAALDQLKRGDTVVAIGYRFSRYDRESYDRILKTITERSLRLVIVSPSASQIAANLESELRIRSTPLPIGFKNWAEIGFPIPNPR